MASILRSSKFVRYIAGFARNVIINSPREFDGNLVNTSHCFCGGIQRSLATQASIQHEQNLERRIRNLDQDVRRSGRISRRDIEDILEEIRNSRGATSSQSLLVIRCCGNLVPEELPEIRTKLVQEIWNTLNKLNIPMDISHYNALLRVYLENEHPFSPTEFLSELESKGIEPNRVTYQRLIARYCQDGDIEGATRILEFMREKQMPVNENVFNALIVGHSQAGDMESAEGIISVMSQAGLEPSADTYTTLLCGYAKKGDIEAINKVLNDCNTKEIYLLDKDFLDIVYALATNGHTQYIPAILDKTRKAIGYNQDAINLIYRLINKGHDAAAYQVFESMPRPASPDGTPRPVGAFFIAQLVKSDQPVQKILEYCDKLESGELLPQALLVATEHSLQLGSDKIALPLLHELQKRGHQVRQHYFWPLLVAGRNDPSGANIINIISKMREFDMTPSLETLRDYILPNLHGRSSDIIAKLRQANISVGSAASSLVQCLLLKGDIQEAAILISRINAYYNPELLKRPLSNALYNTNNIDAYVVILRHVYENFNRREALEIEEPKMVNEDVIGNVVLDLTNNSRKFFDVIEPVLQELVNQGLGISTSTAMKIQEKFGEKMTEEASALLSKLTSGELTPTPLTKKLPAYVPSSQMNIPQLERLIENLEAKQQDVTGLKRQLLTLYCRARDVEKVEKLLCEIKDKLEYTAGVLALLVEVYAANDKLQETLQYLEKLKRVEEVFTIDDTKALRVVNLFVTNDRFDDALNFLKEISINKRSERNFLHNSLVWKTLNYLAEKGKTDELSTLFETLEKQGLVEVNNIILGPLVKVHMVNSDIDKALEAFQWCCAKYRCTPWKNELACKLIQQEDAERLQKLTDLSTSVHGEINSLYDLVFAFVECGRIRQARKILETPGLQNRVQKINNACERYQQEGRIKDLEGLKDATKDLNHINRSDIYYQLLLSYINHEDIEKSLGLWTQMQEEDLAPTDQFLYTLGNFLKERDVAVPFVIPKNAPPQDDNKPAASTSAPKPRYNVTGVVSPFRECLKDGDVDKALEIKNTAGEKLTVQDVSLLIEKLLQLDRVGEASKIGLEMLNKNQYPILKVFRFLLNKLANNGNIETLELIGSKLSSEQKKLLSFDNRICHANVTAGKSEEYLRTLEARIDGAKEGELNDVAEQFPRGGVNGILEKHPELTETVERIAQKYAAKGIVSPMNVLWAHYFIEGNDQKAEQIWTQYVEKSPRIMFQRVLQQARETANEQLTKKLIDHLKNSNVTEGALGNAYSCLLDILVIKQNNEEIVSTFENAVRDVNINYLNRTAVLRVNEAYSKLGKPFSHKIPTKADKPSSTSSSSSSEEDKKKSQ